MTNRCDRCSIPVTEVVLPERYRGLLRGDPPAIGVCPNCLTSIPFDTATDRSPTLPPLQEIADSLPSSPESSLAMILLISLSESLALNRDEIRYLIEGLETAGVDPLLAIDRVATDPDLSVHVDLERRRPQFEQLLYS